MNFPPAKAPDGKPQHEDRQHHGKHGSDDPEGGESHPRPNNLVQQAAKTGDREEHKQELTQA
jgi:hypothetical protein